MRKLKTFMTQVGFYEYAVAVPTKKAAVEILGVSQHDFQHGQVQQTDDQKIIDQTQSKPGVVLARGVGTKGKFLEHAKLPSLKTLESAIENRSKSKKERVQKDVDRKKAARKKTNEERRRVEQEKAFKRDEARRKKAAAALQHAERRHIEIMKDLNSERDKIFTRIQKEEDRWKQERRRLLPKTLV
jgi:colicin import membrane protein